MTNKLALAVAVVLGVLSIVGIKAYVDQMKKQNRMDLEMIPVLVAGRDLVENQLCTENDLEVANFPREVLERGLRNAWIKEGDRTTIVGQKTRTKIKAGQILMNVHFDRAVAGKGLKFPPTHRAVTIPISLDGGLAGMLKPGDYVDIVGKLSSGQSEEMVRTLLKSVLILATDNRTDPYGAGRSTVYRTLTFRLTPDQANRLLFASNSGKIYCLLRKDETSIEPGYNPITGDILYREVQGELQKRGRGRRR